MAGMFKGFTSVGLYDTLGEQGMNFICKQTQLKMIVIQADLVKDLCVRKKRDGEMQDLKHLVVIGDRSAIKDDM